MLALMGIHASFFKESAMYIGIIQKAMGELKKLHPEIGEENYGVAPCENRTRITTEYVEVDILNLDIWRSPSHSRPFKFLKGFFFFEKQVWAKSALSLPLDKPVVDDQTMFC